MMNNTKKCLVFFIFTGGLYLQSPAQPPLKTVPGTVHYSSTCYGRLNPGRSEGRPQNAQPGRIQEAEPAMIYNAYWDGRFDTLGLNGTVNAIAGRDGKIYVGGAFTACGETALNHIAVWKGAGWEAMGEGLPRPVMNISFYNGDVYAGGWYFDGSGVRQNYIAVWNGSTWDNVFSMANDQVIAVVVNGDQVYVGGDFTEIEGRPLNYIAKWNGTAWEPLGAGTNAPVHAIAVVNDTVYAGGDFTRAGNIPAPSIAMWDGQSWKSMGDGINGSVFALSAGDGAVYAGGLFTRAGSGTCRNLARWYEGQWSPLGSGTGGRTNALLYHNGELLAGGDFSAAGDKTAGFFSIWREHEIKTAEFHFQKPGWTLLSLPVRPFYTDMATLFGDMSGSPALEYNAGVLDYQQTTGLACGKGYWVRVDKPGTLRVQGEPVDRYVVTLNGKWQLVGSIDHPLDFTDPPDQPDQNVANRLVGWDFQTQSYFTTRQLLPGGAFWVFADGPGELILDGTAAAVPAGMAKLAGIDMTNLAPPGPPVIEQSDAAPITTEAFKLRQNYPNPFNPQTTIEFSLYKAAVVSVTIYNIRGELVRQLFDRYRPAGTVKLVWDGCDENGSKMPSGVYYVKVTAGGFSMTIKAVLAK